jgi:prepilin-type N-terminal cleavage/methylation domain-containing protein
MMPPVRPPHPTPDQGFTLLELLVVMAFAGILAAIAAPTWSGFVNSQALGTTQDTASQIKRQAQARARQTKGIWSACFRNNGDAGIEYAVQQNTATERGCPRGTWLPLLGEQTDRTEIVAGESDLWTSGGHYYVQYDGNGWLARDLRGAVDDGKRLTFQIRGLDTNPPIYSCVYTKTLLGALQVGRNDGADRRECTPTP